MSKTKIVLYQEWPGRRYDRYGMIDKAAPTRMISVFPATKQGLNEAIEHAERPDAILVKLNSDYDTSQRLIDVVDDKIKAKKFVKVFNPVNEMPER